MAPFVMSKIKNTELIETRIIEFRKMKQQNLANNTPVINGAATISLSEDVLLDVI